MNILAFGASYSKHSINRQLAAYVAGRFNGHNIEVLDLNAYPLPVFTVDLEKESGHPHMIMNFLDKLQWADLIIISLAEHNGAYTAAFKNLFDWTSRVKGKMFEGKKLILLSTSTGGRGAISCLKIASDRFPRHGAEIIGTFSLPDFNDNFSNEDGITDKNLKAELDDLISSAIMNLNI
jgi:NAD(P)H-dependent FMN reductase